MMPGSALMWLRQVGPLAAGPLSSFRAAPPGWGVPVPPAAPRSMSATSAAALTPLLPCLLQLAGVSLLPPDELADLLCSCHGLPVVQGLSHPFFEEVATPFVAPGEAHHDPGQRNVLEDVGAARGALQRVLGAQQPL